MARPYSMDLRERALARVESRESVRVVARALSLSRSRVVKWSQRFGRRGALRPVRWAATGGGFWSARMPHFFGNGSRKGTSPCVVLWQNWS
jgi:hypothetical protein